MFFKHAIGLDDFLNQTVKVIRVLIISFHFFFFSHFPQIEIHHF